MAGGGGENSDDGVASGGGVKEQSLKHTWHQASVAASVSGDIIVSSCGDYQAMAKRRNNQQAHHRVKAKKQTDEAA